MIEFIRDEKIITVGIITSIFTASLMGSFKLNILEPLVDRVIPIQVNYDINQDGKIDSNDIFYLHDAGNYGKEPKKKDVRFDLFIKDLFMWVFIVFIIYLICNFIKSKTKKK